MGILLAEEKFIFAIAKLFFHNKNKLMKPINTSCALILGVLTLFSISNANAGSCSPHTERKAKIECLSDDKKCIEAKEKESLYKVEA